MERKGIEIAVGLFVLAGIAVGALLVLKLGQAGAALRTDYEIVVQFPSASGIIKNAKVMMAGVEIGKVVAEPGFNEDRSRALVRIGLSNEVGIREGSKFNIRQQGLLADPYIEVDPVADPAAPKVVAGAVVEGARTPGLDDITARVEPVLGQMKQIGERLDSALSKIDTGILTPETQADVRSTVSNLNSSVKHIDSTIARINKEFLTDEARENLHGAISNLNSVTARADRILAQAERGEGALHALLKDPKVADDLRIFVHSLREKGVLFYREVDPDEEKQKQKSAPVSRTPDSRSKRR